MSMVLVEADKLRKVANYVAASQEVLKKQDAMDEALRVRAPQVVDALVSQGLISSHLKASKVNAFIENPVELCDAIEKVASLTSVERRSTGQGVDGPLEKGAEVVMSADAQFAADMLG